MTGLIDKWYWFVLSKRVMPRKWFAERRKLSDARLSAFSIDSAWPAELLARDRVKFLMDPWNK